MINISKYPGVFVPFEEVSRGFFKRRRDLPIFTDPAEVADYIQRNSAKLAKHKLQWQLHSGPQFLAEYRDQIWLEKETKK